MNKNIKPVTIWVASVFVTLCSIALVVFAISIIMASYGTHASPNTANLTQNAKTNILTLAIFIIGAAGVLIYGVCRLFVYGQRNLLFALLGIPLAIGCVGETIDLFGSATISSDFIGFGILFLFAIPILLLILPSSRHWISLVQSK